MKKKLNLHLIPKLSFGKIHYEGSPYPTVEAYDILGSRGVKKIDKIIKHAMNTRIEMFGKRVSGTHGFEENQQIIEFTKKKVFELIPFDYGDIIEEIYDNLEFKDIPQENCGRNYIIVLDEYYRKVVIEGLSSDEIKEMFFTKVTKDHDFEDISPFRPPYRHS